MGEKGRLLYLSLHCHHQNDSCIKTGSNESHFKCFINCEGTKFTRQCPQTTIFKAKGEPKRIRTEVPQLTSINALPLGQTGLTVKVGKEGDYIPIATLTHQNDFCIKMGQRREPD